jgi:quercetin dioxygenase-like cupin family protein
MAPAFALGALGPEEEAGFRVVLSHSIELQAEVSRYMEVAELLGIGSGELRPPPELKARLMAGVRQTVSEAPTDDPPLHGERGHAESVDFDALEWRKPDRGSGFDVFWLSRNEESGEMAVLLRGAPGATYPDHAHPGGEQFFVLHGSFADHRRHYEAGDSDTYPPGSVHRDVRVTGTDACVILVVTGPGGIEPLEASGGA